MGKRNWVEPGDRRSGRGRSRPRLLGCTALLLLLTACSRSALEQAFAPDPSLINPGDNGAGAGAAPTGPAEVTDPAVTDPAGPAQPSPSPSTAPGGGSAARPETASPSPRPTTTASNGPERPSQAVGDRNQPSEAVAGSGAEAAPPELQAAVAEVLALGVLTSADGTAGEGGFMANQPVSRGQFAQWLLEVNNAVHGDRPALQVRSATNSEPLFRDVSTTQPNYAAIQGLAEAGILPSSLSGAQEQINFRPDAPLTREDLLLWKVPLDLRQTLPASDLTAVKEAWGFQDASKISSPALRAVLADYSNGDQAVIRRVFGYTTLLQPQKPVTQAEAAAALAYFGSSGQGISAGDVSPSNEQQPE
ncbi:MAG: hypothetical protein HC824_07830 [Synechococcales cyanobacterium RM1_1_8]|nr:hypothetical protein [Synechococcales cyanobacterium RM1_1_8]